MDVCNTCSWPRTDLVLLPAGLKTPGDAVKTADGRTLRSQRLAVGELAVLVEDVPPFAARRLIFAPREISPGDGSAGAAECKASARENTLENGRIKLAVDGESGAITSLAFDGNEQNLVDTKNGAGLNRYLYQQGRKPGNVAECRGQKISVADNGPLVASLVVEGDAPGCEQLTRRIQVVAGLDRVDISNRLDKKDIREAESVHLGFDFNIPQGEMHVDTPWAVVRPELDQLPGSCKNYLTVGRWVDVSNDKGGVTWAALDAPLIEVREITVDVPGPFGTAGWIEKLEPSGTFFSYIMNNYWETNYKASQGGRAEFRYSIRPHDGRFDAAAATRFGIERSTPLVAVPLDEKQLAARKSPAAEPFLQVEPADVIVTSLKPSRDGKALMVRLFNPQAEACNVKLAWPSGGAKQIFRSATDEAEGEAISGAVELPGRGILTLRCCP